MKKYTANTTKPLNTPKNPLAEAVGNVKEFSGVRVETQKQQADLNLVVDNTARDDELVMSHIDIAKLAEKRSDNVKRVLEKLVEAGGIQAPQIEERRIPGAVGVSATQTHYMLNRLDSITLMATINPRFCAALVKRWDELEYGQAQPAYEVVEGNQATANNIPFANLDVETIDELTALYEPMYDLAAEISQKDESPRQLACVAIAKMKGVNLLELFGLKPGINLSGQMETEEEQSRAFCNRQQLREKNRYDLDSYHSIRELGERSGKGTQYVRNKLLEHDLIQRVFRSTDPRSVKYMLTAKGQRFGYMYDPSTETFRDEPFDRVMRTNAQPVFNQSVLDALMR